MSFKREGNDTKLLQSLRNRRIKDLLSEEIPEDEAKLLCNGRFACTVCPYHPIFDTVCMLGIHRKGKKHLHCYEIYMKKKEELNHLISTRKHEQYLQDGTTSINMGALGDRGLLRPKPYDPRVRKTKKGDRKPTINVETSSHIIPVSSATNSSAWQDICQQQTTNGPVQHHRQLKNVFCKKQSEPEKLVPYQSTVARCKNSVQFDVDNFASRALAFSSLTSAQVTSQQNNSKSVKNKLTDPLNKSQSATNPEHNRKVKKKSSSSTISQNPVTQQNLCPDDVQQKYKLLQGSGWKRDWDGKWIKDDDAEFDSDEEPPDIP